MVRRMRREFGAKIKAAALKRCRDEKGVYRCEGCGSELLAAQTNYDHDTPDGLGGEPALSNCRVLCKGCHSAKTHSHDNPIMQKADAVRKKHYGITPRKRSWGYGKGDPLKKKIGGEVVER